MDKSRFPEQYKKLVVIIPPKPDTTVKKDGNKCLSPCVLTMPSRIPHGK